MGIASVILGVLGLVGIGVGLPMMQPALFFGGGACALAAAIIGFIARRSGPPATAGMAMGLLGFVGIMAVYFLLRTRSGPGTSPDVVSVPAKL